MEKVPHVYTCGGQDVAYHVQRCIYRHLYAAPSDNGMVEIL